MDIFNKITKLLGGKNDPAVEMADNYRLLMLAKARWLIIGFLIIHWLISFTTFVIADNLSKTSITASLIFTKALDISFYPALVMLTVIALNAFFHIGWHKLPSLWENRTRIFLHIQIVIDIIAVLALIHYTGGITSWLWPLFLIINLELIYLFSYSKTIFLMGSMAGIGYTILGILEYKRVLLTYPIPYLPTGLQFNFTVVTLTLIWVNLICGFTLLISLYMRRGEQDEIREMIVRDGLTHLYNNKYFYDRLHSEVQRAKVYNRVFSVIHLEIDDFEEYLKSVGRGQANEMIRWVGEVVRMNVRRSEEQPAYEFDIAAYLGDAKYAILLPETGAEHPRNLRDMPADAEIFGAAANTVAQRIRETVKSSTFTYGAKVTVSGSIASFPIDGSTFEELEISSTNGLARASESGNNIVIANEGS